ncbi:MAG TPA: protease pro-enzyme activation domain-containing protein [Terriglobia bacterium]
MIRRVGLGAVALATVALVFAVRRSSRLWAHGDESGRTILITQAIDENKLVTLAGNTRPEAAAINDRGRVPDGFPMDHMLLQLRRSPEQEAALDQYLDEQQDKNSPNFRHWLKPDELGEKYGLADADIEAIKGWLESHGFTVHYVYPNHMVMDISGTAGQIHEAFHTEIHYLDVNGEQHFANMSDPQIPEALAPAVVGVVSLNNFKPHAMYKTRAQYTFVSGGSTFYTLVPADFQTIYNLTPLFAAGVNGTGQTIVVVENSDTYKNDVTTYRNTFLPGYTGTVTTTHPNAGSNCTDPGTNLDDVEADLDAEVASATAPDASIQVATCADTSTTFGGLIAIQNLVSAGSPPAIISMSYGICEVVTGASSNAAFNSAFQSAAAAGVSVFASAGDDGASGCARDFSPGNSYALSGINISGWGETPYNVSVGGTDFEDLYNSLEGGLPQSTYWNSTNGTTFGSAKSYIPEIPWNSSCAGWLLSNVEGSSVPAFCQTTTGADFVDTAAGSGGPSGCATGASANPNQAIVNGTCAGYAKPSWQSGLFGNPGDRVRDIPDVSLFAANGLWSHYVTICASDPASGGVACTGAPSTWAGVGGTSVSAPVMASIQALVDEEHGIRAGNPNPTYYSIAKSEFGSSGNSTCYSINNPPSSGTTSCTFYDVTQGDSDVDCKYNGKYKVGCYLPTGDTYGVVSTQPLTGVTITAAGSGYTSNPTCKFAAPSNLQKYLSPTGGTIYPGGKQATCTATASGGKVTAITLTNAGQGYTGNVVCALSGGGGVGAKCVGNVSATTAAKSYQPSFGATPGWDFATGIGTVNAYNLVFNTAW